MHSAMAPSTGHNRVFFTQYLTHHIYIYIYRCGGQIQYILGQNFLLQHHHLSLIKMQNGEYFFSIFYAMMLYNDALNMHAGICVFYQLYVKSTLLF